MASIKKRRNGDGSTSWDAIVRVAGYPPIGKSFRSTGEQSSEISPFRAPVVSANSTIAAHAIALLRASQDD